MDVMLFAEHYRDVQYKWVEFMDDVIRDKPKFVKNELDVFMCLSLDFMELLLHNLRYNILVEKEDDEYIGTIDGFWFVEGSNNTEALMIKLATVLKEFAIDYYKELHIYRNTPNFKMVFPMITKALVTDDIRKLICCFNVEYKGF